MSDAKQIAGSENNIKNTHLHIVLCAFFCFFFQKFKSLLISELGKVFPEEMAKYKAIHGDDPPS